MDNPFDEMTRALSIARDVKRTCERNAEAMADLLDGNLKKVSAYRLERLKRQLASFNIHTGRWKD